MSVEHGGFNGPASPMGGTPTASVPVGATWWQRLESLNPERFITDLRNDLDEARADLIEAQQEITTLSGGYLTVTTELQLLRQALSAAGIELPVSVLPVPKVEPEEPADAEQTPSHPALG